MTYRERSTSCLSCAGSLEADHRGFMSCRGCRSVLIDASALGELLREVAPDVEFPHGVIAFPREYGAVRRRCPVCRHRMRPGVLFEAAVDQCYVDGIWLASDTLQQILATAKERYQQRATSGDE